VGLAESELALAFEAHDTDLLGAFVAFIGFLLNWLGLFFHNFNRLDLDMDKLLVDGDFMAYRRSIALSFSIAVVYRGDNGLKLISLFLASLSEAARAKIVVSLVSKEFETVIAELGSFRSFVGDLTVVIELVHDGFWLD